MRRSPRIRTMALLACLILLGLGITTTAIPTLEAQAATPAFSNEGISLQAGVSTTSNVTLPRAGPANPPPKVPADWSTYLGNNGRTGFNGNESTLNATTFPQLQLQWTAQAGKVNAITGISAQPVEADKTIFWGSWDGLFHATSLSGQTRWTANLGQTFAVGCYPQTVGIADTPTVGNLSSGPVVYVGGGNHTFYALNAITGATLWATNLSVVNHQPNGDFIWSSAALYNGSIYIGMASFGDCPLVQGQLIQLNASTGAVQHVFNVVANGCSGGGISGSPAIDTSTGILYIASGNPGSCSSNEHYGSAMIALHTSDLSLIAAWQDPNAYKGDFDFVNTPTLFSATINGTVRQLVGTANKDGSYYTFDRANIAAGPLWIQQVANTGDCPQCGGGSISPSAWDGTTLYVAGGDITINGTSCPGSIDAINPATGSFKWRQCITSGHVLGALSAVAGVVVDTAGTKVEARGTSTGAVLFSYTDTTAGSIFYAAASIANGHLYVGNMDGKLFAFGL